MLKITLWILSLWVHTCVAKIDYESFQFGTSADEAFYGGITVDNNGFIYVAGSTSGLIFDDFPVNQTFIAKYTPDFQLVNHTSYAPLEYSWCRMMLFHEPSKSLLVAGTYGYNADEIDQTYLIALDSETLQLKWEQKITGDSDQNFLGISFDPSNDSIVYATGPTYSTEVLNMTRTGFMDCLLVKFDITTGTILNSWLIGQPNQYCLLTSLIVDSQGFMYLPKGVYEFDNFMELSKVSAQGDYVWNMTIDSEGQDYPRYIAEADGVIYGTITSDGFFNTDCTAVLNGTSSGAGVLVYALDSASGTPLWCRDFRPETDVDMGYWTGIFAHEAQGLLYILGTSGATLMGATLTGGSSRYDNFIIILDMDGNLQAVDLFGSANDDSACAGYLSQDTGSLYAFGNTNGDMAAANLGPSDYFITKISYSASTTDQSNGDEATTGIIVGCVVGGFVLLLGVAGLVFFLKQRNTKREANNLEANRNEIEMPEKQKETTPQSNPQPNSSELDAHWEIDYNELEMGEELGSGNFGTVYKAKYRNTQCVVKQQKSAKNAKSAKDFLKEAEAVKYTQYEYETYLTRRIRRHKNICNILGVCTNEKYPTCIVMEYVNGGSLHDCLINDKIELNNANLLRIFEDVAAGMCHVHAEGLLHCDLACRNLLVSFERNQFSIKVADFGLSKLTTAGVYQGNETSTFPIRWSAPEVLRGSKMSRASDVWSFGVVMWEIMESKLPYIPMEQEEVIDYVCSKKILPAPTRIPCPDQFYELMKSCWQFYPAERPSFQDLLKNIKELQMEMGFVPKEEEEEPQQQSSCTESISPYGRQYDSGSANPTSYGRVSMYEATPNQTDNQSTYTAQQ